MKSTLQLCQPPSFSLDVRHNFSGLSTDPTNLTAKNNKGILPADIVGDFAIAVEADPNTNYCFTDGRYNDSSYTVDEVSIKAGGLVSTGFTLHEASVKATDFLASKHTIFYRFTTVQDYNLYSVSKSGSFSKLATVTADQIEPFAWIKIPYYLSDIVGSLTICVLPTSTQPSGATKLGEGVEGYLMTTNDIGNWYRLSYSVDSPTPYPLQFPHGPGSTWSKWSPTQTIFPVYTYYFDEKMMGVVWQSRDLASINITWFGMDLIQVSQFILAAATNDIEGNIYYLVAQSGSGIPEDSRAMIMYKTDPEGNLIVENTFDTSSDGLDVTVFEGNVASMCYTNNTIGVMLARKMHPAADGLNHQGAIAFVVDSTSLQLIENFGQTSGHSFDMMLTTTCFYQFLGIDLGDNFPRGVHLHLFNNTKITSRVVYTFKTLHGDTPMNPTGKSYPLWPEVSQNRPTYQWSNDNSTYTELGGIIETDIGYVAIFASEKCYLDNSRAGKDLNDSRNIGLVVIRKDIENARPANGVCWVAPELIISQSNYNMEGGFYTFQGRFSPQRNCGVIWVTDYLNPATHNATRVKATSINSSEILVLWELWTETSYVNTQGMVIDNWGNIVIPPVVIDAGTLRLNRRDNIIAHNGSICVFSGEETGKKLNLTVLLPDWKDASNKAIPTRLPQRTPPPATPSPMSAPSSLSQLPPQTPTPAPYSSPRLPTPNTQPQLPPQTPTPVPYQSPLPPQLPLNAQPQLPPQLPPANSQVSSNSSSRNPFTTNPQPLRNSVGSLPPPAQQQPLPALPPRQSAPQLPPPLPSQPSPLSNSQPRPVSQPPQLPPQLPPQQPSPYQTNNPYNQPWPATTSNQRASQALPPLPPQQQSPYQTTPPLPSPYQTNTTNRGAPPLPSYQSNVAPQLPPPLPPQNPYAQPSYTPPPAQQQSQALPQLPPQLPPALPTMTVLWDFSACDNRELSVVAGEAVTVVERTGSRFGYNADWWLVRGTRGEGLVPANHLR